MDRKLVTASAFAAALAVLLGALGAHGLKGTLGAEALGWWQTAVQYQIWHALAVLIIGLSTGSWARAPACLLLVGTIVFSGTLYAMALGAPRWFGAITPIGGVTMIAGWLLLGFRASRATGTG